jgi:hypothetical protein
MLWYTHFNIRDRATCAGLNVSPQRLTAALQKCSTTCMLSILSLYPGSIFQPTLWAHLHRHGRLQVLLLLAFDCMSMPGSPNQVTTMIAIISPPFVSPPLARSLPPSLPLHLSRVPSLALSIAPLLLPRLLTPFPLSVPPLRSLTRSLARSFAGATACRRSARAASLAHLLARFLASPSLVPACYLALAP